jgi:hypothetical protein
MRHTILVFLLLGVPAWASAQQRPLVTEDPETVGEGRVLLEAGFDYQRGVQYPASGLEGRLLRLPLLGVSIGVGRIAELQIDAGFYNRLQITDRASAPLAGMVTAVGDSTSDIDDIVIGTKVRLLAETGARPAFGFRFATRLPNAGNESGLGLDTTDFFASVLAAKTVQSIRVVANGGLGILGDPSRGDRQNDVVTYGLSFARAVTDAAEVVAEVNGRADTRAGTPPPGTGSRSVARVGARYTLGGWRGDAALLFGLTTPDPGVGVAAGFTYVFDAFQVP